MAVIFNLEFTNLIQLKDLFLEKAYNCPACFPAIYMP